MDKIIGLVMLVPMLISGLVLTPIDITNSEVKNNICSTIQNKIDQELGDNAGINNSGSSNFILVSGENCNSQVSKPSDMVFPGGNWEAFSQVQGSDYDVKSGFVLDSESNGNFKGQHLQNDIKLPMDFEYTSVTGTFFICVSNDNNIRSSLNVDAILSATYTTPRGGDMIPFDANFKNCRLGEQRYIVNFSGVGLTNLFTLENLFPNMYYRDVVSKDRYHEIGVREDNIDLATGNIARVFNTPYGLGKIVWNGYYDEQKNLFLPKIKVSVNFPDQCVGKRFNQTGRGVQSGNGWTDCIKPYRDKWYTDHNMSIPNDNNISLYTPLAGRPSSTSAISSIGYSMAMPISTVSGDSSMYRYESVENGNCIVTNTFNPANPQDFTPAKVFPISYIYQKNKMCSWDLNLYQLNSSGTAISTYLPYYGLSMTGSINVNQMTGTALMGAKVFNSPADFPDDEKFSDVSYSIVSSDYFDDLPLTNPDGGIDQDYADYVNICTNFSCIEEKYNYPETNYNEYFDNIEIREYMDDFPPFPTMPSYDGGPSADPNDPSAPSGGGITSGFWQLLIELLRYAVDTIKYAISEIKDLILDLFIIVVDMVRVIFDDILEFARWVISLVLPLDYDYEALQLIVNDAFQNSSGIVGVESFKNVFTTITDDWTERSQTNACKVFVPEVQSGFFKGFSVDICGVSEGMNWDLYRGLLSFVIILAALMTSIKMIYKMITLGKNPAQEIVGADQ